MKNEIKKHTLDCQSVQTFEQQVSFQLTGAKATQGMHKVQEIKSKKLALNITKTICTQHVNIRKNYTPKKGLTNTSIVS